MQMRAVMMMGLLAGVCGCVAAGSGPASSSAGSLDSLVQAARADAANRTGRPVTALEVLSAEPVTWRDGSLGCPQPGMAYTMALVPGYRIVLGLDGQTFNYHASRRGAWRFCPAGQAVDPLPDSRI
jgi:hypothetical protein